MDLCATVGELTGASQVHRVETIQALWGGHGEIVRLKLQGAPMRAVVAKHIRPHAGVHPRKVRSYAVEAAFYRAYGAQVPRKARVPRWIGSRKFGAERVIVLEDLAEAGFDTPLRPLRPERVRGALEWLAWFHAAFVGQAPTDLWPVGTYWHLETRRAELAATPGSHWRRRAPELDAALRRARFQTWVHGDAKPANFLWSGRSASVAAVDFQYVGGGVGIRDVVYLLGADGSDAAVDVYFRCLRAQLPTDIDGAALEAEWRALIPVAAEDFARFLAGWGRA